MNKSAVNYQTNIGYRSFKRSNDESCIVICGLKLNTGCDIVRYFENPDSHFTLQFLYYNFENRTLATVCATPSSSR